MMVIICKYWAHGTQYMIIVVDYSKYLQVMFNSLNNSKRSLVCLNIIKSILLRFKFFLCLLGGILTSLKINISTLIFYFNIIEYFFKISKQSTLSTMFKIQN